jgi:hypothetical protein
MKYVFAFSWSFLCVWVYGSIWPIPAQDALTLIFLCAFFSAALIDGLTWLSGWSK